MKLSIMISKPFRGYFDDENGEEVFTEPIKRITIIDFITPFQSKTDVFLSDYRGDKSELISALERFLALRNEHN